MIDFVRYNMELPRKGGKKTEFIQFKSFTYSFNRYLVNVYYVKGILEGRGDIMGGKNRYGLCLRETAFRRTHVHSIIIHTYVKL